MRSTIAWTTILLGSAAFGSGTSGIADRAGRAAGKAQPTCWIRPMWRSRSAARSRRRPSFSIRASRSRRRRRRQRRPGLPAAVLYDNLGTLTEPVTTRAPEAQRYFDQGLRLAYAFNHGEAARAFRAGAGGRSRPAPCATGARPMRWAPTSTTRCMPEAVAPAFAAIAQAMALRRRRQRAGAGADRGPGAALLAPTRPPTARRWMRPMPTP